MLALILCGTSPETIGIEMWNENPTIRAIIKMVTSGRYRFPTIDCDEEARSVMKSAEANMREEVRVVGCLDPVWGILFLLIMMFG